MSTRILTIPAVALALGLSACGGNGDYVDAVNAAQDRHATEMNKLAPQEPSEALEDRIAAAQRDLADDLRAIEDVPDEAKTAHDGYISSIEGYATKLEQ